MFQVVLSGDLARGAQLEDVKHKMAALFKMAAPSVDAMFRKKNQVVKKNIDQATADKYRRAIEKTGAICRVEPMAPSVVARKPVETVEEPESAGHSGPKVVPVQLMFKGEERFTPESASRLSGAPGGLDFNAPGFNRVTFDQLNAMAAFTAIDSGTNRLLLFVSTRQRPFMWDIATIAYTDFPIQPLANPLATFRNFLHLMCRKQPAIILEEITFDFLSGSQLPKYDAMKAEKLSTAVGKAIESGEEG